MKKVITALIHLSFIASAQASHRWVQLTNEQHKAIECSIYSEIAGIKAHQHDVDISGVSEYMQGYAVGLSTAMIIKHKAQYGVDIKVYLLTIYIILLVRNKLILCNRLLKNTHLLSWSIVILYLR
ncbi:MAG: hypothetical protein V7782_05020 [Psychromonas sp.]